jgi:hypothetical protein
MTVKNQNSAYSRTTGELFQEIPAKDAPQTLFFTKYADGWKISAIKYEGN